MVTVMERSKNQASAACPSRGHDTPPKRELGLLCARSCELAAELVPPSIAERKEGRRGETGCAESSIEICWGTDVIDGKTTCGGGC